MTTRRVHVWAGAILHAVRRHRVILTIAVVYLYAFPYFGALRSANELPRIATTMELAERGTFCIDDRTMMLGSRADVSTTPDGRHFQNKAPGLPVVALPVYQPLALAYRLTGRDPPLIVTTWVLRVFVVTLPLMAFLPVFRRVARRFSGSEEARNGALIAFALGSMIYPYGLLFMSHVPAAVLVGLAFALAIRLTRRRPRRPARDAATVGAILGLAMFVEYQAVFAALVIAVYVIVRSEKRMPVALAMGAAVAPFGAALAAYHAYAFGSPWRTGYAYSVHEANRVGFMGIVGPSKQSLLQLFWNANNGLLPLSPWVLLVILGAVAIARNRRARARVGAEALVAGIIVCVYCVFVAALEPSFGKGGWSVGPRYLAVAMPFFAWLAAAGLQPCLTRPAYQVPAYALVLVGVGVNVIAATTYPHWPDAMANPFYEISVRLLARGHAPHSLGTAVGLRGLASLAPLYLTVAALIAWLLAFPRRQWLQVGLAATLACFVLLRYDRLAVTDRHLANGTWRYVARTLEP